MLAMRSTIVLTTLAVLVLGGRVAGAAVEICGDVNVSGSVTASDALLVLRDAVGQPALLSCPAIADLATCTTDLSTTNTNLGTCDTNLGTCNTNLGTCTGILSTTSDALATCTTDLSTTNADLASCIAAGVPEAKPLRTGQTRCFDVLADEVLCLSTGQDGEFQRGAARSFTDNGDGTITDNKTGLVWEKLSNDGSVHDVDSTYRWDKAFSQKVAALNAATFAGHNDWRVPNRFELETLLNLGASIPVVYPAFDADCSQGCTVLTCSCTTMQSSYWSSTTWGGSQGEAYTLDFYGGGVDSNPKTLSLYVRAVRGGS